MEQQKPLRIGIIGAGPAGLCLARYLQVHLPSYPPVSVTIYERDPSRHARTQGGSLDLHHESGQRAMEECGLEKQWRKFARKEGEQMIVWSYEGRKLYDTGPEDHNRPEIDRTDLRNILLDSLHPSTIKYDHQLLTATPTSSSSYLLTFKHSHISPTTSSTTCDILIGADGCFSKIRSLLTLTKPDYSGLTFVEIVLKEEVGKKDVTAKWAGEGLSFVWGKRKGMMFQRSSKETRIYVALACPEDYFESALKFPTSNKELAYPILRKLFEEDEEEVWDQEVLEFLRPENSDQEWMLRKIWELPSGFSWSQTEMRTVTVVGDAAHVMSPFAGEGVNLALLDATLLGQSLINALSITNSPSHSKSKIDLAIKKFEKQMWKRTKPFAEESRRNLDLLFFDDNAPDGFVDLVRSWSPEVIARRVASFVLHTIFVGVVVGGLVLIR